MPLLTSSLAPEIINRDPRYILLNKWEWERILECFSEKYDLSVHSVIRRQIEARNPHLKAA